MSRYKTVAYILSGVTLLCLLAGTAHTVAARHPAIDGGDHVVVVESKPDSLWARFCCLFKSKPKPKAARIWLRPVSPAPQVIGKQYAYAPGHVVDRPSAKHEKPVKIPTANIPAAPQAPTTAIPQTAPQAPTPATPQAPTAATLAVPSSSQAQYQHKSHQPLRYSHPTTTSVAKTSQSNETKAQSTTATASTYPKSKPSPDRSLSRNEHTSKKDQEAHGFFERSLKWLSRPQPLHVPLAERPETMNPFAYVQPGSRSQSVTPVPSSSSQVIERQLARARTTNPSGPVSSNTSELAALPKKETSVSADPPSIPALTPSAVDKSVAQLPKPLAVGSLKEEKTPAPKSEEDDHGLHFASKRLEQTGSFLGPLSEGSENPSTKTKPAVPAIRPPEQVARKIPVATGQPGSVTPVEKPAPKPVVIAGLPVESGEAQPPAPPKVMRPTPEPSISPPTPAGPEVVAAAFQPTMPPTPQAEPKASDDADGMQEYDPARVEHCMRTLFRKGSEEARQHAMEQLAQTKDWQKNRLLPAMLTKVAMTDYNTRVRYLSVQMLGYLDEQPELALETLRISAKYDSDPAIRQLALAGIERLSKIAKSDS